MNTNPTQHHRRSIRLRAYDYSQAGAYFVTTCTHERACLFGDVVDCEMRVNDAGRMVEQCWSAIPNHFPHVDLDAFVVMPNHVHGIIVITDRAVGAKNFSPLPDSNTSTHRPIRSPSKTIGSIIRGFKIGVTKWFRENTVTHIVWQRNYYEHIIRNEESLNRIRQYVLDNPVRWAFDRENPTASTAESDDAWLT
ncbi:MAG TPA: transposase [Candidatus Binatia bacterium]|jgi:REP element-mobilizing transposase RayT|nr:transposase [Candidatus Binatia bacterium]